MAEALRVKIVYACSVVCRDTLEAKMVKYIDPDQIASY